MNSKTFFAAGLIAAAATALDIADKGDALQKLNTPRVTLRGPYYTSRPHYEAPEADVYSDTDHVSTDDDKWSSSSSDSLSSSDYHPESEEESTCERDGDIYACLRKQTKKECNALQDFNEATCLCEERYTCQTLKDFYGKTTCPEQNYGLTPYASPLDNCACQSQAEYDAMFNYEWAGQCKYGPAFKKELPKLNKIRVCDSQTDSDSDCVKIGDLRRRITGSYNNKQVDERGIEDESIYTDPNCDSRLSSCDTNSNEAFSNTDSETVQTEEVKEIRKSEPLTGRLADRYARKYGVRLRTPGPKPKKHGYGHHSKEIDTRSFDTDSQITSYDASNDGDCYCYGSVDTNGNLVCDTTQDGMSGMLMLVNGELCENRTQDENRSAVDDCDSDDIGPGCEKPVQPESERYTEESEETEVYGPSRGTSNSSNSTNDPFSDSASGKDSSVEDEEEPLIQELCANVWFEPFNGSEVWGWANLYQPGDGQDYAGNLIITGAFERLYGQGVHGFHIHENADLSWECKAAGGHYNPLDGAFEEIRVGELQDYDELWASWRGRADYRSFNPLAKLDGDYAVLGRSMVVHDLDGTRVACGIIEPGCSPCADGLCTPPPLPEEPKEKKKRHAPH